MSTPVSELIAADILTTIQTINTANGYNFTLSAKRHSRAGDKVAHLNCIIIQEDPRLVSEPKVYNTLEWQQPFGIGVFILPVELDATPIDQYVNLIIADVQKALMVDRYRSGNALDTQIKEARKGEENLEYDVAVIMVDVNYRTLEINPYVNAK